MPGYLTITDDKGRTVKTYLSKVTIKTGGNIECEIGSLDSLTPKQAMPKELGVERQLCQSVDSEPWLSLLALSDHYLENPTDEFRAWTAEGLVWMVRHLRMPIRRKDNGEEWYHWDPVAKEKGIFRASHHLPTFVVEVMKTLNDYAPRPQTLSKAFLQAATAHGLLAHRLVQGQNPLGEVPAQQPANEVPLDLIEEYPQSQGCDEGENG